MALYQAYAPKMDRAINTKVNADGMVNGRPYRKRQFRPITILHRVFLPIGWDLLKDRSDACEVVSTEIGCWPCPSRFVLGIGDTLFGRPC